MAHLLTNNTHVYIFLNKHYFPFLICSLETEEFDEVVVVANSDDGYSNKKLHRQYTSGANSPDIASPEFNGKRIACTATAAEYDPVSVAVDIDVKCEFWLLL